MKLGEQEKKTWNRDTSAPIVEALNLSPPIGIKARQIMSGSKTLNWNEDKIAEMPLYNLDNPDFQTRHKYEGNRKRDWFELSKLMLEYEKFIDVKNFLGWPSIRSFNGFTIEDKIMLKRTAKSWEINDDLIISKHDRHPNAKAHEKISKVIYGQLA